MVDFITVTKFLSDGGAAVIPWALLALVLFYALKSYPYFIEWVKTRGDAAKAVADREAERNEILRNNNTVISNCTETMKMLQAYMERATSERNAALAQHEQLSAERYEHLEATTSKIAGEMGKVRGDLGILKDRVK